MIKAITQAGERLRSMIIIPGKQRNINLHALALSAGITSIAGKAIKAVGNADITDNAIDINITDENMQHNIQFEYDENQNLKSAKSDFELSEPTKYQHSEYQIANGKSTHKAEKIISVNTPLNQKVRGEVKLLNDSIAGISGYKSGVADYDSDSYSVYGEKTLAKKFPALLQYIKSVFQNDKIQLMVKEKAKKDSSIVAFTDISQKIKGLMSISGDSVTYHVETPQATVIGEQKPKTEEYNYTAYLEEINLSETGAESLQQEIKGEEQSADLPETKTLEPETKVTENIEKMPVQEGKIAEDTNRTDAKSKKTEKQKISYKTALQPYSNLVSVYQFRSKDLKYSGRQSLNSFKKMIDAVLNISQDEQYNSNYFSALNDKYFDVLNYIEKNISRNDESSNTRLILLLSREKISKEEIKDWEKYPKLNCDEYMILRHYPKEIKQAIAEMKKQGKFSSFDLKTRDVSENLNDVFTLKFDETTSIKDNLKTIFEFEKIFFDKNKEQYNREQFSLHEEIKRMLYFDKDLNSVYRLIKYLSGTDCAPEYDEKRQITNFNIGMDNMQQLRSKLKTELNNIDEKSPIYTDMIELLNDESVFMGLMANNHAKLRFISRFVLNKPLHNSLKEECKSAMDNLIKLMDSACKEGNIRISQNSAINIVDEQKIFTQGALYLFSNAEGEILSIFQLFKQTLYINN